MEPRNIHIRKLLTLIFVIMTIIGMTIPILHHNNTSTIIAYSNNEYDVQIPDLDTALFPNPALNIGPGFPAVVSPGENFTVSLKEPLIDSEGNHIEITGAYLFTVLSEDNETLTVLREPVEINILCYGDVGNSTNAIVDVTIPEEIDGGLYDLVLNLSIGGQLIIPRSVWVITSIGDIVKFIHISDAHFGAGTPDILIGQQRRFTGYLLSSLLGVNMILNTGDEADTQSSSQYLNSLSYRYSFAYNVPEFLVPGNHDYPNGNFIKYYEETVLYRIIGGKILIVSVNTDGELGHPSYSTMVKLEEVLSNYSTIPYKIILMHHPVFYYQGHIYLSSDEDTPLLEDPHETSESVLSYYWGGNITETRWFLRLVEDYNVTLVLAGHIHRDQYVAYHSTRTSTTTLFQTTTTLAHGTANYQGLQVDVLNLTNGKISYPFVWDWFVGYDNGSRSRVYNSIPLTKPEYSENWRSEFGDTYFYGSLNQGSTGFVMTLENNYDPISINNTFIITLPWPENIPVNLKTLEYSGNASISLLDYKYLPELGRVALLLHLNLPAKSSIQFVIFTVEDHQPPTIEFKRTLPRTPAINKTVKLYINIADQGWGIKDIGISVIPESGELTGPQVKRYSGSTYLVTFKVTNEYMTNVTVVVTATDYGGNTISEEKTILLSGPEPPQPTIPEETTTSPGTTTSPSGTSTTTPVETTTSPSSTTTSSPTPTGTTTETGGATSSTTSEETTGAGGGLSTGVVVAAVIVVVVIVAAALVLRR